MTKIKMAVVRKISDGDNKRFLKMVIRKIMIEITKRRIIVTTAKQNDRSNKQ